MPIYEYRCEKGHNFEVMQRMTDDPLASCSTCGAPVQRVFHPVAVHFKGSGFYNTDYGTSKRKREEAAKSSSEGSDGKKKDGAATKPSSSDSSSSSSGSSGGSAGSAD
jgi:putative FmdB family regulatory protein